jgi:hypothetical protein
MEEFSSTMAEAYDLASHFFTKISIKNISSSTQPGKIYINSRR